MIHPQIVSSIASIGLDEQAWNALAAGSPTKSVFQTYQWMSSWERVFKERYQPWYVCAEDASGIVGVGPLMMTRGRFGKRVLRFLGDGRADYCDFLIRGDSRKVLNGLFEKVFAARDGWDAIELNNIPADSLTVALVEDICRRSEYYLLQRDLYPNPVLVIKGRRDEASKIIHKAGLRRRQNYFQRTGSLTFKTLTRDDVLPYLDRFFEQHIGRWAKTSTPSLFLDECNRTFYRELAAAMSDKAWLVMSVVEFEGRPLAMHYGFNFDGRFLWYKPSFDLAHAKHSPGLVLLKYLMEYAVTQECDEFDFTIGDEPFKNRFVNRVRTTVQIQIFKSSLPFALSWFMQNLSSARRRFL
jgi:CelD/BcsL family acetyltransferase involved in cellulose biosynthesis